MSGSWILTCSPLFPLVPFCPGSPTSPCRRLTRKEICKLRRSAVSRVEKIGHICRFRLPYLVSILPGHAWGSRGTRKPHRALHPITTSGTNRAFLTLQETREEVMAWKQPRLQVPLTKHLGSHHSSVHRPQPPAPMLTGTPFSPAAPGGPCGPGRPGGPMGPPDPAAPRSPGEP